jgi:hypothetical protein
MKRRSFLSLLAAPLLAPLAKLSPKRLTYADLEPSTFTVIGRNALGQMVVETIDLNDFPGGYPGMLVAPFDEPDPHFIIHPSAVIRSPTQPGGEQNL